MFSATTATTPTTPAADEVADRLAIRALVDAYAHFADTRQPEQQADLYADGARTFVFTPASDEPVQVLTTRAEHVEGFGVLEQYAITTHFNGQSIVTFDGAAGADASGESYCLAHHVLEGDTDGGRQLIVMAIRYRDAFTRVDGAWRFAERRLHIDWTETRALEV
ncbi:nuclear transport factor 2 family protein [Agromyces protaetiae]|uniref:Nuclear transport factor 2 family protein n=1 Tax=Agromyces protaetiae TaxID=2509455 RepID=A0A4P6F9D1_9MICO|nr:nuclear transport factor 2 family protein [Agromyces protaetiae]QAY72492.1 nuclear transport factor 2 family protein [Agromyces protaetiae]